MYSSGGILTSMNISIGWQLVNGHSITNYNTFLQVFSLFIRLQCACCNFGQLFYRHQLIQPSESKLFVQYVFLRTTVSFQSSTSVVVHSYRIYIQYIHLLSFNSSLTSDHITTWLCRGNHQEGTSSTISSMKSEFRKYCLVVNGFSSCPVFSSFHILEMRFNLHRITLLNVRLISGVHCLRHSFCNRIDCFSYFICAHIKIKWV